VAERLGHDPDAEDLAIVACGTKTAIPFFARVCSALSIPFVVLHDGDVYPDAESDGARTQQNELESKKNAAIAEGSAGRVFVLEPTLEAALGIGRTAKDKPRRVLDACQDTPLEGLPAPLVKAVEALFAE
jgi:hypothetical protein